MADSVALGVIFFFGFVLLVGIWSATFWLILSVRRAARRAARRDVGRRPTDTDKGH